MNKNARELLAAAQAGQDIDGRPGVGAWRVATEPFVSSEYPDETVLVGRSVRMSMGTYERIKTVAEQRGMSWSALVGEWIEQGLAAAGSGAVSGATSTPPTDPPRRPLGA